MLSAGVNVDFLVQLYLVWLCVLPDLDFLPPAWSVVSWYVRCLRAFGGLVQILFMFNIASSGNLSFLNALTIVAPLACIDDEVIRAVLPTVAFQALFGAGLVRAAPLHGTRGSSLSKEAFEEDRILGHENQQTVLEKLVGVKKGIVLEEEQRPLKKGMVAATSTSEGEGVSSSASVESTGGHQPAKPVVSRGGAPPSPGGEGVRRRPPSSPESTDDAEAPRRAAGAQSTSSPAPAHDEDAPDDDENDADAKPSSASDEAVQVLKLVETSTVSLAFLVYLAAILFLSASVVANLLSHRQAMNASFGPAWLQQFAVLNTYGAFGSVGKGRYEPVVMVHFDKSELLKAKKKNPAVAEMLSQLKRDGEPQDGWWGMGAVIGRQEDVVVEFLRV